MKSRAMINQILALKQDGKPIRKIAAVLGISRNTVRRHLREHSVDPRESNEPELPRVAERHIDWRRRIDWDAVVLERKRGLQRRRSIKNISHLLAIPSFRVH